MWGEGGSPLTVGKEATGPGKEAEALSAVLPTLSSPNSQLLFSPIPSL